MTSLLSLAAVFVAVTIYPTNSVIRYNAWEPRWTDTCFEMMKKWPKVNIDDSFYGEGKEFYLNHMSRLYLNRFSAALLKTRIEDLKEDDLYYDSCLKIDIKKDSYVLKGYGGKSVEYDVTVEPGTGGYVGKYSREGMGWDEGGHTFATLTDNKTFIFWPDCTFDNKRAWNIMSTEPTLSPYTIRRIHKHATELGFNKEYFTYIRYDKCK